VTNVLRPAFARSTSPLRHLTTKALVFAGSSALLTVLAAIAYLQVNAPFPVPKPAEGGLAVFASERFLDVDLTVRLRQLEDDELELNSSLGISLYDQVPVPKGKVTWYLMGWGDYRFSVEPGTATSGWSVSGEGEIRTDCAIKIVTMFAHETHVFPASLISAPIKFSSADEGFAAGTPPGLRLRGISSARDWGHVAFQLPEMGDGPGGNLGGSYSVSCPDSTRAISSSLLGTNFTLSFEPLPRYRRVYSAQPDSTSATAYITRERPPYEAPRFDVVFIDDNATNVSGRLNFMIGILASIAAALLIAAIQEPLRPQHRPND
jgi:hypothetical protein